MAVSEEPGRKLRAQLVERETETEVIDPKPDGEPAFTVEMTKRVEAVSMADLLFEFLTNRQAYDDGLGGVFEAPDGEEFTKRFNDCWTPEYGERQAARNAAAERQLMGGKYPENEESAVSGESVEGEWSGDTATIMNTRTSSSIPNGERIPPVDHADDVARTWSRGVYDEVRNACEYHLGLEPDEWMYVRGDDVHGVDEDDGDDISGANACHVHCHDAIFIDLGATGLRDEFETEEEIVQELEDVFYPAIEKHVELSEFAKPEAHTREEAIDVRLELDHPGGYATGYLRLDDDEEMMEKPVEFQVFASIVWAMNRQRIARSKVANEAARADMCIQDTEREHGGRLRYKDGEVVCASCGSAIGVDSDTITEYRLNNEEPSEPSESSESVIGVGVGELAEAAGVRREVREYVDLHGSAESVSLLMGQLAISPEYRGVVEEEVEGVDTSEEPYAIRGEGSGPSSPYRLKEMVLPDGGREPASPGGGGAEMVELVLPEERLLRETRLKHIDGRGPRIVIESDNDMMATYEPETAAAVLVEWGFTEPWHAELVLSFDSERSVFAEPEVEPP
jgi:hypothetical protein